MGNVKPNIVATELFGLGPGALPKSQELKPTLPTGYHLMIESLSRGQHTLEFGGSLRNAAGSVFQTSVVDHIKMG
jgi:hypothetical protein